MKLPIYGWVNDRLRMDKLPFLNGKMPVYRWINSSLWVDKSRYKSQNCVREVDGEFRPPTLKGMAVVYIKDMNIYCEVCDCHIKKSNWGKHLKTTKHGIACGEIVVEEVEKKQCWKCRGHKGLEMFRGENATCNGCLAHREKWAGNNAEKVRELWQKYHAEHREEINEKKQVYNQLEVDCAVCGCRVRKNKWARHVRTRKHMLGVEGGGGDGKVGGDVGGAKGGQN